MKTPQRLVYGIDSQGRALTVLPSESNRHSFLVGNYGCKDDSKVFYLEVDPQWTRVSGKAMDLYEARIMQLCAHPKRSRTFAASTQKCKNSSISSGLSVYTIEDGMRTASKLCSADGRERTVSGGSAWSPSGDRSAVAYSKEVTVYDFDQELSETSGIALSCQKTHCVKWSPHRPGMTAVGADSDALLVDVRSNDIRTLPTSSHWINSPQVLAVDFHPANEHQMVTAGSDCNISVWDLRRSEKPEKTLFVHQHWIWSVAYATKDGATLLSSGSDGRVTLTDLSTISSEKHSDGSASETLLECDDAVYNSAWSQTTTTTAIAAFSFDGQFSVLKLQ
ncbi:WD-repeat protein [Aphelenchoides avenae]|nr:WD-repeat protein [Aphelenchus avenae]